MGKCFGTLTQTAQLTLVTSTQPREKHGLLHSARVQPLAPEKYDSIAEVVYYYDHINANEQAPRWKTVSVNGSRLLAPLGSCDHVDLADVIYSCLPTMDAAMADKLLESTSQTRDRKHHCEVLVACPLTPHNTCACCCKCSFNMHGFGVPGGLCSLLLACSPFRPLLPTMDVRDSVIVCRYAPSVISQTRQHAVHPLVIGCGSQAA